MARQMAEQKGLRMPGAPGTQAAAPVEEKKRRERPADEVDEIFGGKARPTKKGRTEEAGSVQKAEVKKVDGLDDVYAALKDSAA